ncbi:MAG: Trk family potassium uptake protein [Erysipelotrichales bacterium]|nr:Trk family potassium uptake protein [Erysipelotrichales bacterium]
MIPISSTSGNMTPLLDALFTSTSAVCVTGLVVYDTATHWSMFGQFVILLMIQIGGLGIVTISVAMAMLAGKKIGLMQRSTLQDALSAPKVGGIVKLTGFILKTTFLIEFLGAILLSIVFCKDFGIKGIWLGIFHSVSAFCNAGFDLMGTVSPFSSLTIYSAQPVINAVIMALIIIGGIGFLVWEDIKTNKHHIKKYRMQTKVVLSTTAFLIIIPTIYFYFAEFNDLPVLERTLNSMFQSITPRTAGFNTVDLAKISRIGQVITIILMLIGGSPGSTAGGMKTTTVAVLIFSAISVFRKKDDVECFGRRIADATLKNAAAILLMYLILFLTGGLIISGVENLPLMDCLFESASAIGTVGLTLGITPTLGTISRLILIGLMFFGRVGGLTLIFAALSRKKHNISKKPQERITVG